MTNKRNPDKFIQESLESFDKRWMKIYMSEKSFEDFRQWLKSFLTQELKEAMKWKEKEAFDKIKTWAFDHDHMIEDKAWKALEKIVGKI